MFFVGSFLKGNLSETAFPFPSASSFLVALFFITDCYAALTGTGQGLINSTILVRFIWALPALFIGVSIGSRKFETSNANTYKKVVLIVLATLSVMLLIKALFATIKI